MEPTYKAQMLQAAEDSFQVLLKRRSDKLKKLAQLKNHALNPLLDTHKSMYLFGDDTAENLARSLIYPSIIGTGLNTSFGDLIQKDYLMKFNNVKASGIKGIDIEFEHAITNNHIYCQLKAGVNTINADDVDPIIKKFEKAIRLIRDNGGESLPHDRFIVGVFSGLYENRNGNYKKIEGSLYPVSIGTEFWKAITGDSTFYADLSDTLKNYQKSNSNAAKEVEAAVHALAIEISSSGI